MKKPTLTRLYTKRGTWGHLSPVNLTENEYRESLENAAPSAPDDCWHCGGYLPRRLRTGGIHLLCSHHHDEMEGQ